MCVASKPSFGFGLESSVWVRAAWSILLSLSCLSFVGGVELFLECGIVA